jgi:hypothetical protein
VSVRTALAVFKEGFPGHGGTHVSHSPGRCRVLSHQPSLSLRLGRAGMGWGPLLLALALVWCGWRVTGEQVGFPSPGFHKYHSRLSSFFLLAVTGV